jgi:hypothetical protein
MNEWIDDANLSWSVPDLVKYLAQDFSKIDGLSAKQKEHPADHYP